MHVYNTSMIDFVYVDDTESLREMVRRLGRGHRFSVDLESDSFHHYGDRIALLQFSDGRRAYIVDPMCVDPAPLSDLLGDVSREKVFHDADYDGRMILTFLGVRPSPVFDTMIAARILGKEKVGLADLMEEYLGISLDKVFQKADWSRRPLDREMLRYAALDVLHLLELRDRMEEEMAKLGRMDWAREEFRLVVEGLSPMPERKPDFTRVKGARELDSHRLAVLQKLLEWRERKARKMDLPPFKVVGTERLLRLAKAVPRNRRELEAAGALSPRQLRRFGGEILRAVEKGWRETPERWPRFPVPERVGRDLEAERILRRFKEARDRRAEELGLDPGFLLPNAVLKELARTKPRSLEDIRKSGILKQWQLKEMGEALAASLE
ncbi:ribonuclease D [Candidatus Solincola sp.]